MNLKAKLRNLLTPCDASAFRIKPYLELHKSYTWLSLPLRFVVFKALKL
jgi:hypothetical protein